METTSIRCFMPNCVDTLQATAEQHRDQHDRVPDRMQADIAEQKTPWAAHATPRARCRYRSCGTPDGEPRRA